MTGFCRLVALFWLWAACLAGSPALSRETLSVRDYVHEKWTRDRGAPTAIQALAQTKDGFLWIGADSGLYRFDGVTFERMPSLRAETVNEGAVSGLLGTRNGDLWIGYQSGRIAIRRKNRLIDVTPEQSKIWIWSFQEDRDASIWAITGTRGANVFRYSNGRWAFFDRKLGIPGNGANEFALASNGLLWFRDEYGVRSFVGNGERLREVARIDSRIYFTRSGIAEDATGNMWFSISSAGTFRLPSTGPTVRIPPPHDVIRPQTPDTNDRQIRFDQEGNLWGQTSNAGIIYIAAPQDIDAGRRPIEERYTQADGLSSDSTAAAFVDARGNIWIGTSAGLDRFSRPRIKQAKTIPPRSPYGYAVVAAGKALYALDDDSLYRIDDRNDIERLKSGLVNAMALCELPDRSVWLGTFRGAFRLAQGKFSPGPEPADQGAILDCATSDGQLWTSPTSGGLRRYDGRTWIDGPFRSADNILVAPIVAAPGGGLLGHVPKKGLFHIGIDGARQISDLTDIPSRSITAFLRMGDTVLIAAPPYLARYEQGRLAILRQDHSWLHGVTGMVDGPDRKLWLIGRAGIARVPLDDIDRAFADPRHRLEARLYGAVDGLLGSAIPGASHNAAARSPDGALWFATSEAIVSVDPRELAQNAPAPAVRITRLMSADRIIRDPVSLIMRPGTSRIEIDFTALDLSDPSNLAFRYRLEGVDEDWITAGRGQRQAAYTNLGPGTYRFHVIARNSDGVWNREGAALDFTIKPTFFQSWTFKLLCALLILIVATTAYFLRLRQVTQRLTRRFEDRIAEREHIARDLHDTLLQSFHGLILHFQIAADKLPRNQRASGAIDEALHRADLALAEGRDRVYELRADFGRGDLVKTWSAAAEELAITSDAAFALTVDGTPGALRPAASDEVSLIGEEAIRNAFRHSRAKTIEVVLSYHRRGLQLLVRDDGRGMPAEVLEAGERPGHFGLTGMRERAREMGGVLKIMDRKEGGTEVFLNLPARAAYARPSFRHRWIHWFATRSAV